MANFGRTGHVWVRDGLADAGNGKETGKHRRKMSTNCNALAIELMGTVGTECYQIDIRAIRLISD